MLFREIIGIGYDNHKKHIMFLMFLFVFGATVPPPRLPVGQGLLIHEVSISHTTGHSTLRMMLNTQ